MNYKKYISSNLIQKPSIDSHRNKSEVDSKVAQFTKIKVLANSSEQHNQYRIALLSRGQMFGDQDAYYERPYQATVTCRSNGGELYRITKDHFQKLKNHGDCWAKITSKYVEQEYLHHRLLRNQQKINGIMPNDKKLSKSKKQKKQNEGYLTSIKGSPLLNKNEIDKRQTFKEIVNGFPFAAKQKVFVESIHKGSFVVTDKEVEKFQREEAIKTSEKLKRKTTKFDSKRKPLKEEQQQMDKTITELDSSFKVKDVTQIITREKKPKIQTPQDSSNRAVYISSRISRCIESMIDDNSSKIEINTHGFFSNSPNKNS